MKSFRHFIPLLVAAVFMLNLTYSFAQDDPTPAPTSTPAPSDTPTSTPTAIPTNTSTATATTTPSLTPTFTPTPYPPFTIDGSLTMLGFMTAIKEAYQETDVPYTLEIESSGPNSAFERFCQSELGIVMSTREMDMDENLACDSANVAYIENLLAHEAFVAVISRDIDTTLNCVSLQQLSQIYGVAAEGSETDIQDLSPEDESFPLKLYAPGNPSSTYSLVLSLIPGSELRNDVEIYETVDEVVEKLTTEDTFGIALIDYVEYDNLEDRTGIQALQMRSPRDDSCTSPTLTNFELGAYPGQRSLLLYTELETSHSEAVSSFLDFLNSDDGAQKVAPDHGLTPASDITYARNRNNLDNGITGATFTRTAAPVNVMPDAEGTVNVGGVALSAKIIGSMTSSFDARYQSVTVNKHVTGNESAWTGLCDGSLDMIVTTSTPTPEAEALCAENEIEPFQAPLGSEAIVFLSGGEASADLPVCLTTNQLVNIFAAPAPDPDAETPTEEDHEVANGPQTWNEVDESFPEAPLFVMAPGRSSFEIDWLLSVAGDNSRFTRSDEEDNVSYGRTGVNPHYYRAAAIGNYHGGGITVMKWGEYDDYLEHVEEDELENKVTILQVDAGAGCITPSVEAIEDGSYPFSVSFTLVLSTANMGDQVGGGFIWHLFTDQTLASVERLNLAIFDEASMGVYRDTLYPMISDSQAKAAEEARTATATAVWEQTATATAMEAITLTPEGERTTPEAESATEVPPTPNAAPEESATEVPQDEAPSTEEPTAESDSTSEGSE